MRGSRGRPISPARIHRGRHHDHLHADHDALFRAVRSQPLSRPSSPTSNASRLGPPIRAAMGEGRSGHGAAAELRPNDSRTTSRTISRQRAQRFACLPEPKAAGGFSASGCGARCAAFSSTSSASPCSTQSSRVASVRTRTPNRARGLCHQPRRCRGSGRGRDEQEGARLSHAQRRNRRRLRVGVDRRHSLLRGSISNSPKAPCRLPSRCSCRCSCRPLP